MAELGPYNPHTDNTLHTPSENGAVGVDEQTVDELLQLRNSLFSLCKTCNSITAPRKRHFVIYWKLLALWTAAACV